ncbi:MAG: PhnD/SsuA/transferrin family substrate-binding protein [Desulfuromonadales bacterium]|nr:PhnD/SsuA/transferrin family substrate-binding protein [Desulfuromonadales bacterium]
MRASRTLLLGMITLCLLTGMLPLAGPARSALNQTDVSKTVVKVGFSSNMFPESDQKDARLAMELWSNELSRSMGFEYSPQTIIFNNSTEMLNGIRKGSVTIIALPVLEYLKMRDTVQLVPFTVAANHVGKSRQFVLITRRDSGIRTFADMRGKSLLYLPSANYEVSHIWLDVLLMHEGKHDRNSFFRLATESPSASKAIMSVFFKQADGAIVNRGALDASASLNPQLVNQLSVVAESKPLMGNVTCVPQGINEHLKRTIQHAALHLHEKATGRQIFTLFHIDRAIEFNASYLDGIEELIRERDSLRLKQGRRK